MIGLQSLTLIQKTDNGFTSTLLKGNWQGVSAMKAAALGNVPDNSVVVRIPLNLLGSVTVNKNDLIVKGIVGITPTMTTEKQIYAAHGGNGIIRVRSVRVCDGLSNRVNHLEVVGS